MRRLQKHIHPTQQALTFFSLRPRVPDARAPRFPKKPEIRQEGDKLVMECILEANPEPEITWYKGTEVRKTVSFVFLYPPLVIYIIIYFFHEVSIGELNR